jgi:excisionase family DNA binding protein
MSDYFTTHQVQDLLKVDRITVYRMLQDGRLRGVKIGKQWRFSRGDIEELLTIGVRPDNSGAYSFPTHCIQPFQNVIASFAHVGITIINNQGERLTQLSNPCGFCSALLDSPVGNPVCTQSQRKMAEATYPQGGWFTCHAGLNYATAPIMENRQRVALVVTGPYQHTLFTSEEVENLARAYGIDKKVLSERVKTIPILTPDVSQRLQSITLPKQIATAVESLLQERASLTNKLQRIAEITSF